MTHEQKVRNCKAMWKKLTKKLFNTHNVVGSCNADSTLYLVPVGTSNQISYYGKPKNSFRYSDHWSWYANLRKCEDPDYIQCFCVDMPKPEKRTSRLATIPIEAVCIAKTDDGNYHVVYGDYFDGTTWKWKEATE